MRQRLDIADGGTGWLPISAHDIQYPLLASLCGFGIGRGLILGSFRIKSSRILGGFRIRRRILFDRSRIRSGRILGSSCIGSGLMLDRFGVGSGANIRWLNPGAWIDVSPWHNLASRIDRSNWVGMAYRINVLPRHNVNSRIGRSARISMGSRSNVGRCGTKTHGSREYRSQ